MTGSLIHIAGVLSMSVYLDIVFFFFKFCFTTSLNLDKQWKCRAGLTGFY